jgi:ribosome-associated toxin RatA of RatAB toxin-antitoxin module
MPTLEVTREIPASAEATWQVLSDVASWPEWLPTVSSVRAIDTTTLSPGARFAISQPKLVPATWQVIAVSSPRHFTWTSRAPGVVTVAEHFISPTSSVRCRVVLRITFSGPLSWLVTLIFGSLTQRYLDQEAHALQNAVSTSSAYHVA